MSITCILVVFNIITDGNKEENNICYNGQLNSLESIWKWLRVNFKEEEEIEMYVDEPDEIFNFKCTVVRERTQSGGILHDGFRTFYWGFSQSQTKPTFDKKLQEMFPFIDSPTFIIFIGTVKILKPFIS
jgi:hypothetical protein